MVIEGILLNNRDLLKLLAILIQIIASIYIYYSFFDILVTEGSFRISLGQLFLIPVTILAVVQVVATGSLIHFAMIATGRYIKVNKLDPFVITGLNTFLYSLIYAIFPTTGPFNYITFTMQETSLSVMLTTIIWTIITILLVGTILKRTYSVSWFKGLLFGGVSFMLIIAFAS